MNNLPSASSIVPRALVIQLARLGDLVQSLPVITALRKQNPHTPLDILCPFPLVPLGSLFPGISRSLPWNGEEWHALAENWNGRANHAISQANQYLEQYDTCPYPVAYNLNNHHRAVFAAHLLGDQVIGPGACGPLSSTSPPWAEYLRLVSTFRGSNRIHLADAFCGLCGVEPPSSVPVIRSNDVDLPGDLREFCEKDGVQVGLVIGAGDVERRIPPRVWRDWITRLITRCPEGQVLLVGGNGERELAYSIQDQLPSMVQGRVWNACGRTTLPQLVQLFSRCRWVIGADTGPLHLGAACGARVIGWYFSRARVHETGPYGEGHWIWQAVGETTRNGYVHQSEGIQPHHWPVNESVELLLNERSSCIPDGWTLWSSHQDQKGMYFTQAGHQPVPSPKREHVWQTLSSLREHDRSSLMELLGSS